MDSPEGRTLAGILSASDPESLADLLREALTVSGVSSGALFHGRPPRLGLAWGEGAPNPYPVAPWQVLEFPGEPPVRAAVCLSHPVRERAPLETCLLAGAAALRGFLQRERARDLEARLRSAQERLLQASKLATVGQFAAGIAHELNSPLAAIQLSIEGARDSLSVRPERLPGKLESAREAVLHCRNITGKLLRASRAESTPRVPSDLNQAVRAALELVETRLRKDRVEVDLDLAPLPATTVSLSEVQQVVMNLLVNARDAVLSPGAAGRAIRVRTRVDGDRVVLEVEDSGPGVPEEIRDRIFEPFFTTKPPDRGTGLGLSISRELAEENGGQLELEGPTLFRLSFPPADRAAYPR
ncbi:MAG: ATP-binding protein [Candidatus Eremiobacterota bacterium]